MDEKSSELRVDRSALTVTGLNENDEDAYWRSKTPLERLEAIEINRRIAYGYFSNPPRFQRVLEIARRT